jgi:hypothetical protein
MTREPLAEVEVVDRGVAARWIEQPIGVDADEGGRHQVRDVPEPAGRGVCRQSAAELQAGFADGVDDRADGGQVDPPADPRQRVAGLRGGDQRGQLRAADEVVQIAKAVGSRRNPCRRGCPRAEVHAPSGAVPPRSPSDGGRQVGQQPQTPADEVVERRAVHR